MMYLIMILLNLILGIYRNQNLKNSMIYFLTIIMLGYPQQYIMMKLLFHFLFIKLLLKLRIE